MLPVARFQRFFLGTPPSQEGGDEAVKNANSRERLGFAAVARRCGIEKDF